MKQFHSESSTSDNSKIKGNKKRMASRGNQTIELLINSAGKRTVVVLNHSFFTGLIPFSL